MDTLKAKEVRNLVEEIYGERLQSRKLLLVVLGLLGDFDSFEQIQSIVPIIQKLINSNIDFRVIGIGNEYSKNRFCDYTNLPTQNIIVKDNNDIHNKLKLSKGSMFFNLSYLNLLLMCLGVNSPGTIKEVIRGYLGDRKADRIFKNENRLFYKNKSIVNPELFRLIAFHKGLRPFELASLRLSNLIEVLSNWNIYMFDDSFLTQRGGTFLLDSNNTILYSHKSKGLLNYSYNMSNPNGYIEKFLIN